jgi:hypothetical protein
LRTIDPPGLPSLSDLLRYQMFAVLQYNFTSDALYFRQTRQLQNLGIITFPFTGFNEKNIYILELSEISYS